MEPQPNFPSEAAFSSSSGGLRGRADWEPDEEWWWVLGYGLGSAVVVVLNLLLVCSVLRNAFLRKTNTHRFVWASLLHACPQFESLKSLLTFANVISKIFIHFSIVSIKIGLYRQMFLEL